MKFDFKTWLYSTLGFTGALILDAASHKTSAVVWGVGLLVVVPALLGFIAAWAQRVADRREAAEAVGNNILNKPRRKR